MQERNPSHAGAGQPASHQFSSSRPQSVEEDALRAAYQAVLQNTATTQATRRTSAIAGSAAPSAGSRPDTRQAIDFVFPGDAVTRDDQLLAKPPRHASGSRLKSMLKRPYWIAGSVIGVCLLASSIYLGLSYVQWADYEATLNEPMAMAGVLEENELNNLSELERQMSTTDDAALVDEHSEGIAAVAIDPASTDEEQFTLQSLAENGFAIDQEVVGRADPFAPLVQANGPMPFVDPNAKKDVLDTVRFTGFIGDIHAKDKLAIFKIGDSLQGEKTLFKKAGDKFVVEGESITVSSIGQNAVQLKVSGRNRSLALQEYQDLPTPGTTTATGGSADSSNPNLSEM